MVAYFILKDKAIDYNIFGKDNKPKKQYYRFKAGSKEPIRVDSIIDATFFRGRKNDFVETDNFGNPISRPIEQYDGQPYFRSGNIGKQPQPISYKRVKPKGERTVPAAVLPKSITSSAVFQKVEDVIEKVEPEKPKKAKAEKTKSKKTKAGKQVKPKKNSKKKSNNESSSIAVKKVSEVNLDFSEDDADLKTPKATRINHSIEEVPQKNPDIYNQVAKRRERQFEAIESQGDAALSKALFAKKKTV